MALSRTADVARTAHDQTHVNRLGVPEFGVVSVQVKGQGGSASKCYRDVSSTTPVAPPTNGADTFHFAPGPQYDPNAWTADATLKDKVQIVYDLHNPQLAVKQAKVEIFARFSKTALWSRTLTDAERIHGEHTLQFNNADDWDGDIGKQSDFPDGFLTAEFSPYKLKLTVTGDGVVTSPTAWTYLHVMVGKLELEYGPKTVLPSQSANLEGGRNEDTYDDLMTQGGFPALGGTRKLHLDSDIFAIKGSDRAENKLFTRYKKLWGDGPQVPIFCKVFVKSSADTDVVAVKALGKLPFLWDWESTSAASPTSFTSKAEDYLKDKTKPKGLNCHKDRGGKRAEVGDDVKLVFPRQSGKPPAPTLPSEAFPFKVKPIKKLRTWAANSFAWNDGAAASKTGVMFQPSRMAGDQYKLTVYVNQVFDRKKVYALQVDTDAPLPSPAALKAESGNFQIWRRVHVRKYVKKNAAVAETINLATVTAAYAKAFLDLKDETAGAISYVAAGQWNARITTEYNKLSSFNKLIIDATVDQHAAGTAGVQVRTRAQFETALANSTVPADPPGAATFMADPNNGMDTDAKYGNLVKNIIGRPFSTKAFSPEAHTGAGGCTIFHTTAIHSAPNGLLGFACDVPDGKGSRCGFLLCSTIALHTGGDTIEFTAAHEFGHHFFLPHTPDAGEKKDYKVHDSSVTNCIMSYNVPVEFCGFCQLRMRGWTKAALDPNPNANSKT